MHVAPLFAVEDSRIHGSPRTSLSLPHSDKEAGAGFLLKKGRRHHHHQPDKAPYPLDYSHDTLNVANLHQVWEGCLGHGLTWVDFGDNPPKKVLDLGCGSGVWASLAVQEWPDCEVVGFDLVDVQYPLEFFDYGNRIKWVHGNFLSTRLPFEDETFDYVHITFVAKGVPETKWDTLYAEVQRVVKPGGTVEVMDEDIIFPVLPRWYTSALHPLAPGRHVPPQHDYALLEKLFYSVFERRFINLNPTVITKGYFSAYFANISTPTAGVFPMPSYRLPPRPTLSELQSPVSRRSLPFSTPSSLPPSVSSTPGSTYFAGTETSFNESYFDLTFGDTSTLGDDHHQSFSSTTSVFISEPPRADIWSTPLPSFSQGSRSSSEKMQAYWERVYNPQPIRVDKELSIGARTLPMHLWVAVQTVSACKEAMWEELQYLLLSNPEKLERLGWLLLGENLVDKGYVHIGEEGMEASVTRRNRRQFEELFDQYCHDMNLRVSADSSLEDLGWTRPTNDPRSEAELLQLERLHEAYEEAREQGLDLLDDTVCRVIRLMIGYRGNIEVAH